LNCISISAINSHNEAITRCREITPALAAKNSEEERREERGGNRGICVSLLSWGRLPSTKGICTSLSSLSLAPCGAVFKKR